MLKLLFGDEPGAPIVAVSATVPASSALGEAEPGVEEVIDARIYAGIHYRTSDEDGATWAARWPGPS